MATNAQSKGRLFLIVGMFTLAAASVVSVYLHLDFLAGIGYGIGGGAVIASVLFMRRGPSPAGHLSDQSSTPTSDPNMRE